MTLQQLPLFCFHKTLKKKRILIGRRKKSLFRKYGDADAFVSCLREVPRRARLLPPTSLGPSSAFLQSTMVAIKKTKKAIESINSRLALVMKSGKYTLGFKSTLKTLRQGKCKRLTRQLLALRVVRGCAACSHSHLGALIG